MKRNYIFLFISLLSFVIVFNSSGQVLINEVMSSNYGCIANENGHYEDWIELYNTGNSPVDLAGYGLSDNAAKLYKFTFPSYQLPSHDHVLIFADDTNLTDIGSHWASAVKANDTWRYRANTTDPIDTNWRNLSFNETVWSSGPGGFGFGDGDDSTVIPVCASVFIRKSFTITDTSKIMDAVFNMDYDDGFVAYLNGVEIARANIELPGSRPAWSTLVYSSHEAVGYQGMPIDSFHFDQAFLRTIIRNGTNVLAVQVHNRSATESDMSCIPYLSFRIKDATVMFSPTPPWFASNLHPKNYFHATFKLSQSGETVYLTNPAGTTVDQIAIPVLELDNSYGRNTDGENLWKYFGTATPDTTNNISTGYSGYATIPLYSLQGGFYSGAQSLTLTTTYPGGVVRYTTNGNAPTATSPVYSAPIAISTTSSFRARVFSPTSLPSPTITNSYFINFNCKLPVYCLTLDSADLWDYNKGIFVKGPNASPNAPYFGANYWQDWEKYVSIEFFDKQKNRAFKFNTGLSITGGWSRRFDQKCLEIKLSDKYALSKLQYEMIPDKKWINKWNDFLLHTTGNDRGIAHMRDPVMERLMKETNSDYTAFEPCLLFINGVQWGVYYTKENDDQHFVEENYGYGKSEIDLLKESYFFPDIEVKIGSDTAFRKMHTYAMNTSPSASSFYATMDSMIEIKNQVDYFAAECYYPNDDWMGGSNNNLKMWRPKKSGGRFRYILYDLDFGFGISGTVSTDILSIALNPNPHNYNSDIFQRLLQNAKYKNYFINRYADLINTIWKQENVINVVNSFRDSIRYDMHYQYDKWGGDTNIWNNNIATMLTFSGGRAVYARNQIQSDLGMTGQVTLTLQASPVGAGRIQISTITPQTLPWNGVYFNGNPVTVTAIPNPGYTFDHWHSNVAITTNDTNPAVTRNFAADDLITAYFTGSPITPQIIVSEINYNSDSASNAGDWFELHNMTSAKLDISGWKVKDGNDHHQFVFPVTTTIPANGYLVVSEDTTKFRAQHPTIANFIGQLGFSLSDGGDQIRLYKYNDSLFLSLEYSDQAPWTTAADGEGYTLELKDSLGDFNDGNNWFAGCPGGSPGRAYTPTVAAFTASRSNTICQGDTLILTATAANGNQYQWMRNNTLLSGATTFSYQPTQNGSYTLSVSNNGCNAVSDSVVVTINAVSANPVTSSVARCGNGSVTLTATAVDTVNWFSSQNNLAGTGTSFTTPVLTQTTIYFARAGSVCPSQLIADTVTINLVPATPVVTNKNICGHGVMTLKATSNGVIRWYDAPNGNLISTGDSLVTPDLSQTRNYYVQAGDICKTGFVMVTATVNPISAVPVSESVSQCGGGVITLHAVAADSISWYDSQNNPVGTGANFTTPMISQFAIYFVRAGSLCPSAIIADTITINPVPSTPVTTSQSICGPGVLTLTATSDAVVKWYDAPNGNFIFAGNSFTTPNLNLTTTYYAQSGTICKSNFIPATATVYPVSATPVTSSVSRCDAGVINLYASATDSIFWYDAPNGNFLNTGAIFQTPFLNATATYYLRAGTVCPSNFASAQAIISATTPDPVISGQSHCGAGSVTFTAIATDTVRWYDSPNGNLLFTGNTFTTPPLSQSTTYYATSGQACISNEVAAEVTINAIPESPAVTGAAICGPGSLVLTAQSNDPVQWYDAPNGNLLFTGNNYNTPVISQTTNYFARSNNICASAFVPVTATVNSIPADPITSNGMSCGSGIVDLTASGVDTIRWYATQGGNMLVEGLQFSTPVLNQTTTYYVRAEGMCAGNYIPVQAIINTIPQDAVASDQNRCGNGSLVLNASSGDTIRWYDSPNGNVLATGNSFTTPPLNSSAVYFVRAENGCGGNFISVHANINAIPQDAVSADQSRCGNGSITLNATSGDTIRWYDSPNGNLLASGNSFTTPSLNSSAVYYVRAENGCAGNFIPVQAIVNPVSQDPVTADESRCGSGRITLNAISGDTIRWYDSPNGNMLASGNSFITPVLNSTTVYYVRAEGICPGNFIAANAIVNPVPVSPVAGDMSRCGAGSLTLSASGLDTLRWYDSPNGNLLGEGSSFITPLLNQSTVFYVRTESGCPGDYISVQAIIHSLPTDPTVIPGSTCGPGTVVLIASSPDTISWYDSPNGTMLGTGMTYQTQSLSSTTTYYVSTSNGCQGIFIPVNANVFSIPQFSLGNDTIIESGSTVTMDAGSGFASYLWNTGETSQTALASSTGNYWVTVTDLNGCSVTDTIQVLVTVNVQPYVIADGVLIYPNPTHSTLSISFINGANEDIFLRLINADGKLIWSDFSISEKRVIRTIDLEQYARGIYVFQIATPKTKREYKVILK